MKDQLSPKCECRLVAGVGDHRGGGGGGDRAGRALLAGLDGLVDDGVGHAVRAATEVAGDEDQGQHQGRGDGQGGDQAEGGVDAGHGVLLRGIGALGARSTCVDSIQDSEGIPRSFFAKATKDKRDVV